MERELASSQCIKYINNDSNNNNDNRVAKHNDGFGFMSAEWSFYDYAMYTHCLHTRNFF